MQLDWTSADGETLNMRLTNTSDYIFFDVIGLGSSPDCDILTQRSPWQHGQTTLRCLPRGRVIKFSLAIHASSQWDLQNNRKTVGRLFSPITRAGDVNAGTLTITADSGAVYTIVCVAHGAEMPAGARQTRSPHHQVSTIYLEADDPYFYGGGYSQSISNGSNIVANGGQAPASPVLSVTGPASAPSIYTVQDGDQHTLDFIDAIAAGFRLDINAGYGFKTAQLIDTGTLAVVDVFASLTPASRFFDLLVGNNTLIYAGGGTASLSWANRYQTIL